MTDMENYEKFTEEFIKEMTSLMELGVAFTRLVITRVNEKRDAVIVRQAEAEIAPVVYLDDKYALYRDGYLVKELAALTVEQLNRCQDVTELPELSRETAKEQLYCAVVNAKENEELLREVPHERLEDLAVVARYRVSDEASFLMNNVVCGRLKMTSSEVIEMARANMERQQAECRTLAELIREEMIKQGMSEAYVDELLQVHREECPMYVLTNPSRIDGAAVITSKKVLEEVRTKIGEDFYILPSSRHEVILIPESAVKDVRELEKMVREVNANEVKAVDRLSDNVYRYEGRTKCFSKAEALSEVKEEALVRENTRVYGRSH